jgi:hypothetical protein
VVVCGPRLKGHTTAQTLSKLIKIQQHSNRADCVNSARNICRTHQGFPVCVAARRNDSQPTTDHGCPGRGRESESSRPPPRFNYVPVSRHSKAIGRMLTNTSNFPSRCINSYSSFTNSTFCAAMPMRIVLPNRNTINLQDSSFRPGRESRSYPASKEDGTCGGATCRSSLPM